MEFTKDKVDTERTEPIGELIVVGSFQDTKEEIGPFTSPVAKPD